MCQVVAYWRLKTIENSKTVSPKSALGRLQEVVLYERFQYKSLTENIFGVLGRWSLMEGGCTWRFDFTFKKGQTGLKFSCWSICLFRQQGVSLLNFVFNFVGLIVVCVPSSP